MTWSQDVSAWYKLNLQNLRISAILLLGKVLLFTMVCLSLPSNAASCVAINASQSLPKVITSEQCFELQGGNVIEKPLTVRGRLFIKAGRTANLTQGASLVILEGGRFTVRGTFEVAANTQVSVDHLGTLENQGQMILQSSSVLNTRGEVKVKNSGQMHAQANSLIELNGKTEWLNRGIMDLARAHLRINHQSKLTNQGHIKLHPHSFMFLAQQSLFYNDGNFEVLPDCHIEFKHTSRLFSRNPIYMEGQISMRDQSIFENHAILKLQDSSIFHLLDAAQIYNRHNFEISGNFTAYQEARFLNEGLCQIDKQGALSLTQHALFLNTGTFANNHGQLYMDNASNFVNQNIISGQMSQQSKNPSAIIPTQTTKQPPQDK